MEIGKRSYGFSSDTALKSESKLAVVRGERLTEGKIIRGEILDLKKDGVTVLTEKGEIIKARLENQWEAQIGQMRSFKVVNGSPDEVVLEMKDVKSELMKQNLLKDALVAAGFKNTPENVKLAMAMLENKLPLDKETITKFNQMVKLVGAENVEKALFLMKNEIKATTKNAEVLNNIMSGNGKIKDQVQNLAESVNKLSDSGLREKITNILTKGVEALSEQVKGESVSKLFESKIQGQGSESQKTENQKLENSALEVIKIIEGNKEKMAGMVGSIRELLKNEIVTKDEIMKLINNTVNALKNDQNSDVPEMKNITPEKAANVEMPTSTQLKAPELRAVLDLLFLDEKGENARLRQLLELPENTKSEIRQVLSAEQKITAKFNFDPKGTDLKDLDIFMNELKNNIELAKVQLQKSDSAEASKVLKYISDIEDNMTFSSQIKNTTFIQVPLNINNQQTNAELFIFNDKKKSRNKNKGDTVSALIALDTLNLGRFEAYLQKSNREINCQFRLNSEETEKLVLKNINLLNNLLAKYKYTLTSYSFKQIDESFTIMQQQPDSDFKEQVDFSRLTFDLRT